MADFDVNKYIKANGGGDTSPSQGFDVAKYIKDNKHHAGQFNDSALNTSPQPSIGETLLHHVPQGALAGFSDEISGAADAGADLAGVNATQEKADESIGLRPDLAAKPSKIPDYHPSYIEGRDDERKALEDTHKANPITATLGQVAGGIAPAVATGGSLPAATALGATTGVGSSNEDIAQGDPGAVMGTAKDATIGGAMGLIGGTLGKVTANTLNPENLEVAGSKLASSSVGLKPTKELTKEFSDETGKVVEGSNVIKGIGKTAMDEGALPMVGGADNIYDKTLEAIDNNYKKLNPLIPSIQEQLNPNLVENVSKVGHIEDKIVPFADKFVSEIPQNSQKELLSDKLFKSFDYYKDKLAENEGNLDGLIKVKRELQEAASSLKPNVFDPNAAEKATEAKFLKQLSGIVRQHTEDLAATVNPEASTQLHDINQSLSNLYTYKDAARKLIDKPNMSIGAHDLGAASTGFLVGGPAGGLIAEGAKLGTELATGNPINRLAKMGAAHTLNAASEAIETPVGNLVQKSVTATPLSATTSPFTQESLQNKYNEAPATKLSANLYNATDDSLKQVAGNLAKQPGLKFLGDELTRAINSNDQKGKERAIFVIQQNKAARQLLMPNMDRNK